MKSALITGANRGLGFELVKVFTQNGWRVYAASRNKADFSAVESRDNIVELELDVSDQDSIKSLRKSIDSLDVLINNAGVYDTPHATSNEPHESMDKLVEIYRVNSVAPRLIADVLTPQLRKGSAKLVITIGSAMSSFTDTDSFNFAHWPYSASKAAMSFAMLAYAEQNKDIISTMIHPGWMKTDMGGPNATVEPSDSAQKIFELIAHPDLITANKMINIDGKVMPF